MQFPLDLSCSKIHYDGLSILVRRAETEVEPFKEEIAFLTLSLHPSQSILTLSSIVCICLLFLLLSWPWLPLPADADGRCERGFGLGGSAGGGGRCGVETGGGEGWRQMTGRRSKMGRWRGKKERWCRFLIGGGVGE
jgi:hypothetical protein